MKNSQKGKILIIRFAYSCMISSIDFQFKKFLVYPKIPSDFWLNLHIMGFSDQDAAVLNCPLLYSQPFGNEA